MLKNKSKKLIAILLSVLLSGLIPAAVTLADNLVIDGDNLEPVSSTTLDCGEVIAGSTISKSVLLTIVRNGNGQVFKADSEIVIHYISSNDVDLVATNADSVINTPTNWVSLANNNTTETVSSTVTLSLPIDTEKEGPFTKYISYEATGTDNKNQDTTLTRAGALTVKYTVVKPADTTVPTATHLLSPNDWTNVSVKITVNAQDLGSGLKSITGPSGTIVTGTTAVYTTATNGAFNFRLEDNAGNITDYPVLVNKIDTTAPTATHSLDPNGWTNGNVEITVNATDTGSGINSITGPTGIVVDGAMAVFNATTNDSFTFILKDIAGNSTNYNVEVNKIDATAPTGDHTLAPSTLTNEDVEITVTAQDSVSGIESITTPSGTVIKGSIVKFIATESNSYVFILKDNAGNTFDYIVEVTNIDKTKPTATHFLTPSTWTGGNVEITVKATDTGSGIKSIIGPSGTVVVGTTAILNTSVNGTFTFTLEDMAGNSHDYDVEVSKIDTAAPEADHSVNPKGWTNGSVEITLTATDLASGLKSITGPSGTVSEGSTALLTVDRNGTYTFNLEDNVGNTKDYDVIITNIDKISPEATHDLDPEDWTNQEVKVTVNATDKGGSEVRSITDPSGAVTDGATAVYNVAKNGSYTFIIKDNAGNTSDFVVEITNIDTIAPEATQTLDPNGWTNGNVKITVNATDLGGSEVKSITDPSGMVTDGAIAMYTVQENGTYTFVIEDNAGNTSNFDAEVTNIDTIAPEATQTLDPNGWTNGNVEITVNATDLGGSEVKSITDPSGEITDSVTAIYTVQENGTYSFVIEDNAGNTFNLDVEVTNIDTIAPEATETLNPNGWTNGNVEITVNATDLGGSKVKSITDPSLNVTDGEDAVYTVKENGTYNFVIEDNAGNTSNLVVEITNIDTIAPEATKTLNPSGWTNGNVEIMVNATDLGGSEVRSITDPFGTVTDGATAMYTVQENGPYTFVIVDNAGNTSEFVVDVEKIDRVNPTSSSTINPLSQIWTNGNVNISVTGDDDASGIESISILNADKSKTLLTLLDGATNKSKNAEYSVSVNGTYVFLLKDNAGNSIEHSVVVDNIDKTKPEITITTPVEGASYQLNEVILADWSATDSLSGIASSVGTVAKGVAIDTASIGTKTFTVTATDIAGNTETKTATYKVIYDFDGFFQPIDMGGVINIAKAGSSIPIKFSLNGYKGMDILIGVPKAYTYNVNSDEVTSEVETIMTSGKSNLSYDPVTDQYTYVWKTDKVWAGSGKQLAVTLSDGTIHYAYFKFK